MIQFLTSWNGHEFGSIASLGGQEAGLIAAGLARNYTGEAYSDRAATLRYSSTGTLLGIVSVDPSTGIETVNALGGGGSATYALLTDAASVNLPTLNTALSTALGLKAPLANPTFTGLVSHSGADLVAGAAVVGNAVDFTKGRNTLSLGGNVTLTFAGAPATNQAIELDVTGDTVARTITLPASVRSIGQQAIIASFVVPANWSGPIFLMKTATGYDIDGEPLALTERGLTGTFGTNADGTTIVCPFLPSGLAGTIVGFVTDCDSGTATYQLQINGVNVTGGSNAVSTTRVNNAPSGANTTARGDEIGIVKSANSSALGVRWTVLIQPNQP